MTAKQHLVDGLIPQTGAVNTFKMLNEIKHKIGCIKSARRTLEAPQARHPGLSCRGVGGISPPPAGGQAPLPSRHPQQELSKVNRGERKRGGGGGRGHL